MIHKVCLFLNLKDLFKNKKFIVFYGINTTASIFKAKKRNFKVFSLKFFLFVWFIVLI